MKKLFFVLVMLFLVSCSDGGSDDPTIQLYSIKVDLKIQTTYKSTDTGRIQLQESQDIILLEKSGLTLDDAYEIKKQYPSSPVIETEVRPDPWNLTIVTKKTYKVTIN